jgi:anti-sigma factor (TIGR02949 family)
MSEHSRALIPCSEAVRQLWDYLDGAVPMVEQEQVEAHLAFCRRCCGELEFVEHLRAVLAAQATDEAPPPEVRRLEHFIEGLS